MKRYELGHASRQNPDYANPLSVKVDDTVNVVEVSLTGDTTVNLDSGSEPVVGDRVTFKFNSDGSSRTVTFGTGFTAQSLATTANKSHTIVLEYDGTNFVAVAGPVQID